MLKNSEKRLKAYRPALWVISVLLVVSCATAKKTTTHVQQQEVTNSGLTLNVDSQVTENLKDFLSSESDETTESDVHLYLYDTEKPIDKITGRPPLRAELNKKTDQRKKIKSESTTISKKKTDTKKQLEKSEKTKSKQNGNTVTQTKNMTGSMIAAITVSVAVIAVLVFLFWAIRKFNVLKYFKKNE